MIDREKVIKGLECCTNGEVCFSDCPYFKEMAMADGRCITAVQADALELLKEQEAQRDYEASVEMAEYCERYEQTYNPEDGSM